MSSELDQHQYPMNEQKKRRRGDSRLSRQTIRHQCFCDKIYLSYPALYLHLKNKHPECFLNNRKIEVTKFKQLISPQGFKILKIQKQNTETTKHHDNYNIESSFKHKQMPNYPFPNYNPFSFPMQHNLMMPHLEPKPYYMEHPMQNNMQMPKHMPQYYQPEPPIQKVVNQIAPSHENSTKLVKQNIITFLNLYISETVGQFQLEKKQVLQLELMFSLFIRCIKEKADKFLTLYNLSDNLLKNENMKYLEIAVPYFKHKYFPNIMQKYQSIDQNNLSNEQKFIKAMMKINSKLSNLQLATKQIEKFQQWLLTQQVVDKFELIEDL